jgi:hypothetical protein
MEFLADTIQQEKANLLDYIAYRDAKQVQKACKGMGTNDTLLIQILCSRTKEQIRALDLKYREFDGVQGSSLAMLIKSECGGDYGDFLKYLTQSKAEYMYSRLCSAIGGFTTNESLLAEIFCLNSHEELLAMKDLYESRRDCDLGDKLRDILSGHFEDVIMFLLLDGKNLDEADQESAEHCAKELDNWFTKGCSMIGFRDKHRVKILELLADESVAQIALIKEIWAQQEYQKGRSLEAMVKDKFSGDIERTLLLLLMNPVDATCWKLKKAFDGRGCDEAAVARAIGGADKPAALQVAARFMEKYDKDLVAEIKDETSGNFCKALVAWLEAPEPTGGAETDEECIESLKDSIAELDAHLLHSAEGSFSTDTSTVVQILCRRTKSQLEAIDLKYREMYDGTTLHDFCKSSLSGDFEQFAVYTQMSEAEFDTHIMLKAFSGMGCNKAKVIEILTTRHYGRIQEMRVRFEAQTDENLADRIRSEMSSSVKRLCLRLVSGPRGGGEGFDAAAVATSLFESGEGQFGTDEAAIIDVFTSHSLEQMQEVSASYEEQYECSLVAAVTAEFSGHLQNALLGLLTDPLDTFCRSLKAAGSGTFGTDEELINRVIGGNDKRTAKKIAARYFEKYDKDLATELAGELSGGYKKAITAYLTHPDPTNGMEDMRIDAEEEARLEVMRDEFEALAAEAAEELRAAAERAANEEAEEEAAERERQRAVDEENARLSAEAAEAAREAAVAEAERQAEEEEERRVQAEREAEELRARLEAMRAAEAEREREARRQEEENAARLAEFAAEQRRMHEQMEAARRQAEAEAEQAQESDSSDNSSDEDDDDERRARKMNRRARKGLNLNGRKAKKGMKRMFGKKRR